ncbi:MAG: hypothetical protein LBT50_02295 [Prevotellaceae bacterium]|jgi:hypothetical protein|nr:hypothetical protein [Prevotellaceae bacterium]
MTTFKQIHLTRPPQEEDDELIFSETGNFSDGRPYLHETWCWEHITGMTVFTYPAGFEIENFFEEGKSFQRKEITDILKYLENEGYDKKRLAEAVSVNCLLDDDKDKLLSINMVVGIDD